MWRSRWGLVVATALLVCLKPPGCYAGTDDDRPNIRVEGGHLVLQGSPGRNISLSTRGSGIVSLNGVDVVGSLTLVRAVRTQLESLNNIELNTLLYNLSSVAVAVASETRLVSRLNDMQHNASTAKAATVTLRNDLTALRNLLDSRYNTLTQNISALRQSGGGGGGGGGGGSGPSEEELNAAIANINRLHQDVTNYINAGATMQQHITNLEREMSELTDVEVRLSAIEMALNSSGLAVTSTGELSSTMGRDVQRLKVQFRNLRRRSMNLFRLLRVDECTTSPCLNGGTCIDGFNKRTCICPKGWTSEDCSQDVNECYEFFGTDLGCQNGATCANIPGGYTCSCVTGWHGVHCTQRANNCSLTSSHSLCGHGTCVPSPRGQHPFTCICDQGWKAAGRSDPACVVDVDECSESKPPCSHDPEVSCINIPGSFVCGSCPQGYEGNGFFCRDVDECQTYNGGCSLNPRVECVNTRGSSRCGPCPPGYTGDGRICTQAPRPCQNSPCHPMATCYDNPQMSPTFYQCVCPSGYAGNGIGPYGCTFSGGAGGGGGGSGQGVAVNPCSPSPCVYGTCAPYGNTYTCTCTPGYTGRNCEADFDECSSTPCLNGGTCTQGLNSYTCMCPSTHTGDRCQTEAQSCGGLIRGSSGFVSYPQIHGQNYNHNISCAWVIRVNYTKVINVTFSRFHLESGRCNYDWLQIHDGRSSNAHNLGRFCGTRLPGTNGTIISTHNYIYLWFRSDHSYAGTGFNFTWNATDPVCGGVIQGQDYGSVNSPGYPGVYPHNRDCYWTIYITPGKRIKFHFATLQIEHHPNCSYDFVEVRDGASEHAVSLGKFCSTTSPAPVTTSGPEAYVHFHSDPYLTDSGFHISFSSEPGIPGCGGLLTSDRGEFSSPMQSDAYRHNMHCEWVIRVHPEEKIELNFTDFHVEESSTCYYDYIEIRDGDSSNSPLIGRFCGQRGPPPILSSSNQLFVLFHSDYSVAHDGFTATYEVSCGGMFHSPSGILRSPYHPLAYPHDRTCVYIIALDPGKAIHLNFTDFDIEPPILSYVSETCYYDYIEILDGSRPTSPSLGRFCGPSSHRPDPILSTLNYMYIKFVTDGTVNNRGFVANYTSFDISCGGVLRNMAGSIQSPNEEGRYPHGVHCTWVLDMPPGHAMQLTWTSFMLEGTSGRNCHYDYVEVFDNATALREDEQLIGRYCGTRNPPAMTSLDNLVTIIFHSDSSVAHAGFSLVYHAFNLSTACGGNYHTPTGMIKSPNYPRLYPDSVTCEWTITAPVQQQVRLNFTMMDIEGSGNCVYDYVEIRNGHDSTSPLLGKYCGRNRTIPEILSHAHTLYVKFVSDVSVSGRGFQVFWDSASTGCGGMLTAVSGEITSPAYPQSFGIESECYWLVQVSAGSIIKFYFVDLDVAANRYRCYRNYVEVRDGPSKASPLLGKFCSSSSAVFHNSSSNSLHITYVNGRFNNGRGFKLQYHAECNTVVKGHRGVIESPNFPYLYPHERNCTWTIKAPRGNSVNVSFSHFEVEDSHSPDLCEYDYVEFKMGRRMETQRVPLGSRYCGSTIPAPLSTPAGMDTLLVTFLSDYSVAHNGFRLEWVVHGCGGELTKPTGNFQSPNYPNAYPVNTDCDWYIRTGPGTKIEITIHDFDLESPVQSNCVFDTLKIYGGPDTQAPLLNSLCHRLNAPVVVTTQGNNALVSLHSDGSVRGGGFSISYRMLSHGCGGLFKAPTGTIHSPSYPQNYDAHSDCTWTIEVAPQHVVRLTFTDFDVEPGNNCSYDAVFVHDGDSLDAPLLESPFCGPNLPSPATLRSSSNVITVRLKADGSVGARGFTADYSTGCGATIAVEQGVSGELHSPHYPHSITAGTICAWHLSAPIGSRVLLHFTHMDIKSPMATLSNSNETCEENFVGVHNGALVTSPLIGKYCGSRIPHAISSASNMLTVVLAVMSAQGVGFRAVYSIFGETCGGDLTSEQGEVASPEYPNSYPTLQDCEWTIKAGPGNQVQMNFVEFKLEESEHCNLDYIEIHEKDAAGTLLAHNCSTTNPGAFIAQESLWLKFRSDDTGTSDGFLASYSLLHGNSLYQDSGEIVSPMYPHIYMNSGTFTWTITASQNRFLYFLIIDMEIEANPVRDECFSSLVIHDGPDASAPVLHTFCGRVIPTDPVVATGNVATVVFISNHIFEGSKFRLQFEALDSRLENTTVTQSSGNSNCSSEIYITGYETIRSPNYPNNYPSNQDCTWIITTDIQSSISVYLSYKLEESPTCSYDKIEIYDGIEGTRNWNLTRTLCNRRQQRWFRSSGRFLKIRFVSDAAVEERGFVGYLSKRCGGILSDADGIIDHSEASHEYTCVWIIHVGIGRTIGIEFEDFRVINSSAPCGGTYITLQNGDSETSPFLGNGKYCGTQAPIIPESAANKVRIVYRQNSYTDKGFRLRYRAISQACGGRHHITPELESIEITTPNFPHVPNPHTECEWVFMGPANKELQIEFKEHFDVTVSQGCKDAKVEIRNGGTRLSPVLAELCGNEIPYPYVSSANTLYVRYFNDLATPHHGFKAVIKIATCGGTIYSQNGLLTSPGYPRPYEENINCTWTLVGPLGHYLTLHVLDVDIANTGYNCSAPRGVLEIRELNKTGELLSRQCGRNTRTTTQVDSASNKVSIIFKAGDNSLRNYKGFRIMYNASKEVCGGLIEASEGIIQSPGYPYGYSHRRRCEWHIRGPPGRRITIEFLDLDIRNETYTGRSYTYTYCWDSIYFRNGNPERSSYIPGSFSLCNSQGNFSFSSSMNEMLVRFFTYGGSSNRGFKARFTTDLPQECGGPLETTSGSISSPEFSSGNYNHNLYCLWTVQNPNPSNSSFIVSFPYLDLESYCYDRIYIEGVEESGEATLIKKVCANHMEDLLVLYPILRITFVSDSSVSRTGWNMTYSLTNCGGRKRGPQDIITSPNYPQQYPDNAFCAWMFSYPEGDQIKLDFTNFGLEDALDHDYVRVYNGPFSTSPVIGTYSGSTSPGTVGPSMSHDLYVTFNSDGSVSNTGFRAIASQVERGCGGIFHGSSSNFSTYGYPSDYPANSECEWIITVQPSYHIILSFVDRFDIETSAGCQNDFVQVSNGRREGLHGPMIYTPGDKKCGKASPPPIVSATNAVHILFRSNANIQGQGFKISWTQGCGENFTASNGYIMSPEHPERYPRNADCTYRIFAPPSSYVFINFMSFNVEGGYQCPYDSVRIFEGSNQKFEFCGRNADEALNYPVITQGPTVIKFVSDSSVQMQGFVANFTIKPCGGNLTRGGIIEVPQGEIFNMACIWDITAPEGKIVHFKFLMLHVEGSYSCQFDYVGLYNDHVETEENLIGKYCGSHAGNLPILTSTSSRARVVYKTDPSINYPGFRLSVEFSYSCGGNINISREGASEEIRSLDVDHDGKYEPMITCKWLIMGLPNQVVNLTFTRLDVEPPAENDTIPCPYDYVHILDGPSHSSSLGKYCGSTLPQASIMSASSIMYVIFHSDSINQTAGFTATVTNALHPCGTASFSVTNTSQALSTPGYPSAYPVNIRCRWILRAPEGQTITVHFDDFNLEPSSGCSKDFLHVSNFDQVAVSDSRISNSGAGHMMAVTIDDRTFHVPMTPGGVDHSYCGSVVPHDLDIESGFFQLTFRSDESITAPGFNIHFSLASCNRTHNRTSGLIEVRGNSTCLFTIQAPPGHFVNIYFNWFYGGSAEGEECGTNGVKIYDGSSAAAPSLATYCGYAIPMPVFSSSNTVFIEYHETSPRSDISLTYTTHEQANGCGGLFTHWGTFTSPGYPNLQNGLDCWFTISGPPTHVVAVYFSVLDFSGNGTSNCNSTHLELYDVSDTGDANLYTTLCANDEFEHHISTVNRVMIHFVTGQEPLVGTGWRAWFASAADVTEALELAQAPRASPRT